MWGQIYMLLLANWLLLRRVSVFIVIQWRRWDTAALMFALLQRQAPYQTEALDKMFLEATIGVYSTKLFPSTVYRIEELWLNKLWCKSGDVSSNCMSKEDESRWERSSPFRKISVECFLLLCLQTQTLDVTPSSSGPLPFLVPPIYLHILLFPPVVLPTSLLHRMCVYLLRQHLQFRGNKIHSALAQSRTVCSIYRSPWAKSVAHKTPHLNPAASAALAPVVIRARILCWSPSTRPPAQHTIC